METNKLRESGPETPTPRTDALVHAPCPMNTNLENWSWQKYRGLARQLERQLTAARAELAAKDERIKELKQTLHVPADKPVGWLYINKFGNNRVPEYQHGPNRPDERGGWIPLCGMETFGATASRTALLGVKK